MNYIPIEKISLKSTVSVHFQILRFLHFFFLHLLIDLVGRTRKFFSTLPSSFPSQSDKTSDESATRMTRQCSESESGIACSREQVEIVMKRLGISWDPEGAKIEENTGSDDVLKMFDDEEPYREEVKAAFDVFDENGDGVIEAGELQRVLCALGFGEGLDIEECRRMITAFDEKGGNKVDFEDFAKLMEKSFC